MLSVKKTSKEDKPRMIFKKLAEKGKITQLDQMQLVGQVSELNPFEESEDEVDGAPKDPIPSMLHFFDKTDLESFSLEDFFRTYDED